MNAMSPLASKTQIANEICQYFQGFLQLSTAGQADDVDTRLCQEYLARVSNIYRTASWDWYTKINQGNTNQQHDRDLHIWSYDDMTLMSAINVPRGHTRLQVHQEDQGLQEIMEMMAQVLRVMKEELSATMRSLTVVNLAEARDARVAVDRLEALDHAIHMQQLEGEDVEMLSEAGSE